MTLALSDGWTVGLASVQMAFNLILAVFLMIVAARTRRIATLETEIKESASKLVDQRLGAVTDKFQAATDRLADHIDQINHRLQRGEDHFKGLDDRDQKLELKIRAAFDEVKDVIRDGCASKGSMESLSGKVDKLQVGVAALSARGARP